MIPNYSFKLKFNVNELLNPNWDKPFATDFFVKNYDTYPEWENIINVDFLKLLNDAHPIVRIMVFNKPANWCPLDAHIDPGTLFAFNIVLTECEAKMQWVETNGSIQQELSYSKSNTPYLNYEGKDLTLVHEECIDNIVSIVRTDIPHRIKVGNSTRTCISLRFKNNLKTWDEVYKFYKSLDWIA